MGEIDENINEEINQDNLQTFGNQHNHNRDEESSSLVNIGGGTMKAENNIKMGLKEYEENIFKQIADQEERD